MTNTHPSILEVSSSGRLADSMTRRLQADVIANLAKHSSVANIVRRDVSEGIPFIDNDWITANFTPDDQRTETQIETLSFSDTLIDELKAADTLVIGAPMYNFSLPATLKAWFDQIARARVTFRYTDAGPVGLLNGKRAIFVVATGGVAVGSPADFLTPYLRHMMNFIGITDVEFVAADRLNADSDDSLARATRAIHQLAA